MITKIKTNERRMDSRTSKSSSKRTRSKYHRKIKIARRKDEKVVRIVKDIKKIGVKVLRDK